MNNEQRLAFAKAEYEGSVFPTNKYGDLLVLNYVKSYEVLVEFITTGYRTMTSSQNILKGNVRDRSLPSVYGVGIIGKELTSKDGKNTKEYLVWHNMLQRSYDPKYHKKCNSYKDCSVSENFKHYPYFKDWCNNQIGFNCVDNYGESFELDKDLLIKGNKVYSEDTCVFLPSEINITLVSGKKSRGKNPIGVYFNKERGKYQTTMKVDGKPKYLGRFDTEHEAFLVYKEAKETHVKSIAEKWKDKIDPRTYNALLRYEVEITD